MDIWKSNEKGIKVSKRYFGQQSAYHTSTIMLTQERPMILFSRMQDEVFTKGSLMNNDMILKELKELLVSRFGEEIRRVILFGSQVSGEAQEFSDYDILIVLGKEYDWRFEKEIVTLCYDIDLKYNIVTDIKIISENDLSTFKGKQEYILNAIETGVAV